MNDDGMNDDIPKHFKHASRRKQYGIEYWGVWFRSWGLWKWYTFEVDRDRAFENVTTKCTRYPSTQYDYRYRKVNR